MFKPYRRLLRDMQQLTVRGNHFVYERVGRGKYRLYIWPNTPISIQEIHAAAAAFRKPLTKEEIESARAEAKRLAALIRFAD